MNPLLGKLHPYPFERQRELSREIRLAPGRSAMNLGIGEPRHATPELIRRALIDGLDGLSRFSAMAGEPALR